MITTIKFAKLKEDATIPTKRLEDAGYDLYANFDEDFIIIEPNKTVMIGTGICSAFDSDYVCVLKERGSTGTKGIGQRCGVIDSGFRNEWKVPITNHNDYPLVISKLPEEEIDQYMIVSHWYDFIYYPYEKAISQFLVLPVPYVEIEEYTVDEIKAVKSERGEGMLGSSGK